MIMRNKKVLFIVPYPTHVAPSQRFRVELFIPYIENADFDYRIAPFMDANTWKLLYRNGNTLSKASGILKGFLKRWKTVLFDAPSFDYVFIHREAAPIGPPVFEWILAKLWRKKIIYDFDDAIWIPNTSNSNKLAASLKANWKVGAICKWAYKVTPGNDYLCQYARQYNTHVIKLPTCVDMERMHNKVKEHGHHPLVVGWTGSHSTLPYLNDIIPAINKLQQQYDFTFTVIADKKPELDLPKWNFIPWNEATEIDDLLKIDIGIMPLKADTWSEGKCGFKLIQYLSLGIPAVASPVGVNKVIIEDGINGFLAGTTEEWEEQLEKLITDAALRAAMGKKGHQKMLAEYSVQSQKDTFLSLFQ